MTIFQIVALKSPSHQQHARATADKGGRRRQCAQRYLIIDVPNDQTNTRKLAVRKCSELEDAADERQKPLILKIRLETIGPVFKSPIAISNGSSRSPQ